MSNLAGWVQAVGAILAGAAALLGAINRGNIHQLRREVNGQTHALVNVTHALGVSEGVAMGRASPLPVDPIEPEPAPEGG